MLFLVARFLLAVTRHYYWFSVLITGFAQIVITVANRLKIIFRDEPIIPGDLAMIKAWKSLLGMMGTIVIIATIVLVVLVIFSYCLFRKEASTCIPYVSKKECDLGTCDCYLL